MDGLKRERLKKRCNFECCSALIYCPGEGSDAASLPRFGATEPFDEMFCLLAVELLGLMMEATGEQAQTV